MNHKEEEIITCSKCGEKFVVMGDTWSWLMAKAEDLCPNCNRKRDKK